MSILNLFSRDVKESGFFGEYEALYRLSYGSLFRLKTDDVPRFADMDMRESAARHVGHSIFKDYLESDSLEGQVIALNHILKELDIDLILVYAQCKQVERVLDFDGVGNPGYERLLKEMNKEYLTEKNEEWSKNESND